MIKLQRVCYVRLGTRDLEGATRFATNILGWSQPSWQRDACHFKSDQREHTLCYFEGDPTSRSRPSRSRARMTSIRRQSSWRGLDSTCTSAPARRPTPHGARVHRLLRPDRKPDRAGVAAAVSGPRYHGTRDAGITGFSHIGLCTTDAARDEAFWTQCATRASATASARRRSCASTKCTIRLRCFAPIIPVSSTSTIRSRAPTTSCARFISSASGREHHLWAGAPSVLIGEVSLLRGTGWDGVRIFVRVRSIADELLYRERHLRADPKGFCQWGAKPRIREFM